MATTTTTTETRELPAWLWKQITGLDETSGGDRRDDRRGAWRVPISARATVWWPGLDGVPGTERSASCMVRDVSLTGVGLVMSGPMRPGTRFVLHLPCLGLAGRAPVPLACAAVRCERRKEGDALLFRVGAQFTAFPDPNRTPGTRATMERAG